MHISARFVFVQIIVPDIVPHLVSVCPSGQKVKRLDLRTLKEPEVRQAAQNKE